MKLWRVSRQDHGDDEYDEFICAAETADAARLIHPSGIAKRIWNGAAWLREETWSKCADDTWAAPDSLEVKEIGVAADGIEGVVCASFNAS